MWVVSCSLGLDNGHAILTLISGCLFKNPLQNFVPGLQLEVETFLPVCWRINPTFSNIYMCGFCSLQGGYLCILKMNSTKPSSSSDVNRGFSSDFYLEGSCSNEFVFDRWERGKGCAPLFATFLPFFIFTHCFFQLLLSVLPLFWYIYVCVLIDFEFEMNSTNYEFIFE